MKPTAVFMLLALAACQDKPATPPTTQPNAPVPDAALPTPPPEPNGVPMQMQLNSTPAGATAFVDGISVGVTPVNYTVHVTNKPIEFTFKLKDHGDATYSFVPKTAGEVHGRLTPTPTSAAAATAPQPPVVPAAPNN